MTSIACNGSTLILSGYTISKKTTDRCRKVFTLDCYTLEKNSSVTFTSRFKRENGLFDENDPAKIVFGDKLSIVAFSTCNSMIFELTSGHSIVPKYQAYTDTQVTAKKCEPGTIDVVGIKNYDPVKLSWESGIFEEIVKEDVNKFKRKIDKEQSIKDEFKKKSINVQKNKDDQAELNEYRTEFKNW